MNNSDTVVSRLDSLRKSIVKAISWRFLTSLIIFATVYLFTNETMLSVNVTIIDIILKLILYYAHERAWMRVHF